MTSHARKRTAINRFSTWTRYELHLASWLVAWAIPRVRARGKQRVFIKTHEAIRNEVEARNAELLARWNHGMRPPMLRTSERVPMLLALIERVQRHARTEPF